MKKEDWPRTEKGNKKECHGRLPPQVPETSFLADPTHRKKTVGKHFYSLAALSKKSLVSTQLASKMKCAYGYMLYDIRSLNWEDDATTIKNMAKAPLEHRFGEHKYCSEKWCRVLQAKKEGKSYSPPALDPFLCKKKDKQIYEQFKEIFDKFTSEKILKESLHWMNTQQNEAMNNVIARLCPKNKHLSETTTLLTRVCIAITYSNIGISKMYSLLLQRLGVPITGHLKMCLEYLDQIRTRSAK
mgnify:CR=1 FL=1